MAKDEAYREAEQRIEEARRSEVTELNLSRLHLTELPDSLWQLTLLQSLFISGAELTNVPDAIGQLTQLKSLTLSGNNLTAVPDNIGQLAQLQSLNLSHNKLTTVPDAIGQLSQLQSLNLSGNQLTDIPDTIGQLAQLQSLNLFGNQLTAIPDTIGQLSQLQSLNLSHNKLTAVPDAIGQLALLQSLNLSSNELTAVPDTIGQLVDLQSLDLSYNEPTAVPDAIGQLVHLQSLDLSYNKLSTVPEFIGQLAQLQKVNLSNNALTTVPDAIGQLAQLQTLILFRNQLTAVPDAIGQLALLQSLNLSNNKLTAVPDAIGQLTQLQSLNLSFNQLTAVPDAISQLTQLQSLDLSYNKLSAVPEFIGQLAQLQSLYLSFNNRLSDLPPYLARLEHLKKLDLDYNPLNPELAAAYEQGLGAVKAYLRAKAAAQITLNEAKLILVGEGEVGKTCLMDALAGAPWQKHPTTHGIEIRAIIATDPDSGTELILNGWDFGGQRVYRPTHQLFFSSPAVYLVIWKPREGSQAGAVQEWIKLIKRRAPDAKIIVVATHGGPQQRQPDIDRQEIWDLFGRDTILDFFFVDSKPDENGERRNINELKEAILRTAANLPEMGRTVPESFQEVRQALADTDNAYMKLDDVLDICQQYGMDDEVANLFVTISHRLGHLIHYQHDPALRDIVVLKPDWLAKAISFVLDDKETRENQGLIPFSRLSYLWNDLTRDPEDRYPADLHPIFLRLMERFDLSYRVAGLIHQETDPTSLIGQLVPDTRPQERLQEVWLPAPVAGDNQQMQICRIVDEKGEPATAEGLFYQLIVRLHRYSLGRDHYHDSVHWQRGLVLDDDYNGRAYLQHIGNDVHITVRAPYPEGFLQRLTGDVKHLVENFWEGLRCDVMVPCIEPCGENHPGTGLFNVGQLIVSKRRQRLDYPCSVCNEWQPIDALLRNSPAAQPLPTHLINNREVLVEIRKLHGRFDNLDKGQATILSQADDFYNRLIQAYTDEAKEGPRLFSFVPIDQRKFNPKSWIRHKFRLTLWCEHSRLPLPILNGKDSQKGVYEIELTRDWFKKYGPYLKFVAGTLSLALPVALSAVKFDLNDPDFKAIEEQLDLSSNIIDATIGETEKIGELLGEADKTTLEHGERIRAEGGVLRELHAILKKEDPSFGGLIRVSNKRQEFLWVHERFEGEY